MKIFWATRDFNDNSFHIEEINPKYYKEVGLNQTWEINDSNGMELEVYVEDNTLELAASKALFMFI
jgi:hypothetical protein